jgi:GNAT superfamily N-acetyltransferase
MPVEDYPQRGPNGRVLLDAAGTRVGTYDEGMRGATPIADLFEREPSVSAEAAAAAVLAELRGWRIAGDEDLGRLLLAAGGKQIRHGHLYSRDLAGDPPPRDWDTPPGIRLTDIDRPPADLVAAQAAAYPRDHPDFAFVPDDLEAEMRDLISGGRYGPLLAGSGLAVAGDEVVGAIILGALPGDPPLNGPWLIDLFRAPGHRGVGRALLQRALALATVDTIGLIVSEGNDGPRRLYETLRFALISSALVVEI